MHRKNRRNTNCGNGTTRGVDLNRNFGYEWGANNTGSSPDPCSDVYRGESAFSEPETQAVRILFWIMTLKMFFTTTHILIYIFMLSVMDPIRMNLT